jgi:GTP cyclohydrolase N terminal
MTSVHSGQPDQSAVLTQILASLQAIQQNQSRLGAEVDAINGRVNTLADIKTVKEAAVSTSIPDAQSITIKSENEGPPVVTPSSPTMAENDGSALPTSPKKSTQTSKIILTTYPGQSGIDPIVMNWGEKDPEKRGPVVVSRGQTTVRRRNGRLGGFPFAFNLTKVICR